MMACPAIDNADAPCNGTLVLDVTSKPNWKLGCNRSTCNTILRFKEGENIKDITPEKDLDCDSCGSNRWVNEYALMG